MQKFLLFICMCLVIAWGDARAQGRTVSGKVTSTEAGSPLPGVNVVIKGTTTGTVTDGSGDYTIDVPDTGGILVFSFIRLSTQEIEIGDRTRIDLQMAQDITELSEVVVTSMNIASERKALGYSVESVSGNKVQQVSEPDPLRALSGKVPGM